ncbi:insulinase family protein [Pedobacter psychrodurus]|uniref:Insulinase family protein n=1 Tax=Pedobacter psychrodurus TaxID=2530456 RepID=A0A4R0PZN3_9SPHI|nr:pitrilysin family protein [Pedobacter psychrodurus]TCD28711.1 insulinase family protein [Pedobacter psychrodurus]
MKKIILTVYMAIIVQFSMAQKLDRSKKPLPGPAPIIQIKNPVIFKLETGLTVLVVENHQHPKITATFSTDGGPIFEGKKAGVIGILSGMLKEGTIKYAKAELDEKIDQMGAELSVSAGGSYVSSLTPYFQEAFTLMIEALREPAFSKDSFDKLKSQHLSSIKSEEKNVTSISSRVVRALSFGPDHALGEFATARSVEAITLEDVKTLYREILTPSKGYLTIVGDITPDKARSLVKNTFGNWKGPVIHPYNPSKVENLAKTEVNIIDLPSAVQSEITVLNLIELPLSSPDYHAVLLANQILGVGANGRLFKNLREKHGFTYGAYSAVGSGRNQTTFSASASVRNDKVDSAVFELLKEIKLIGNEIVSEDALQNAKNLYNGNFALNMENPAIGAGFASSILVNKLPKDFYKKFLEKLNAVTQKDVMRVSQQYFMSERARIVIVGNSKAFSQNLKASGLAVKYFDIYANPVPEI